MNQNEYICINSYSYYLLDVYSVPGSLLSTEYVHYLI